MVLKSPIGELEGLSRTLWSMIRITKCVKLKAHMILRMYNESTRYCYRRGKWRLSMPPIGKYTKAWKLVQRENAARYLLISLFSFIATISVVRSFLALAGYPQIGSGTLHIAHVLWGGLLLFIAAILPLIYVNPRLHLLCAVLSGAGIGLFLDEVGKFITRADAAAVKLKLQQSGFSSFIKASQ